ncbi:hypothetical protein Riv7116_5963 [Rivularia sp. PCC 7116]|uniref:hypothetical protein n=1 Tax=Rivularia sp. PCC 7116 TaxID=373994 RepID=UPI00029EFEEB|nr:hypothetical protein [Rivularia sp. PCC 7116]AFY58324.1 hypothetical protein Riv7116_5963 [Rivularia sp. PCC 7116]
MKRFLTVPSVLFNSFLVITFAACGVNSHHKADICLHQDSEILVPGNKITRNQAEEDSHPMLLPKEPIPEDTSHPMVISVCPNSEN